jgi:glycosyltransferase involved in cell wall biosynthesis
VYRRPAVARVEQLLEVVREGFVVALRGGRTAALVARGTFPAVRVVRIITRLNVGGPSIQAITLSQRLAPRGFETLLVYGRLGAGEGDMRYLIAPGAATEFVPALRRPVAPLDDARALARIVALLRRVRPHIVHTHMAKAGSVGRVAAAIYNRTVARSMRAKVVHTYHGHVLEGYFGSTAAKIFTAAERALARVTDAIVAISPAIQRELLAEHRIGRAEQYRVVPLGFDLVPLAAIDDGARRQARADLGIEPGERVVTTVGRLTAIKQHALYLETAALVARTDERVRFLIAGDGELRDDLERQAAALGIAGRVRFLGWRRDLAAIYGATDVFLLTSRNEGTPVALIESLAAGVPGVSTDVGGIRDVITGDDVGLVAPFGDARALADRVLALAGDAERRRRMGDAGRQSVLARYSLERLVDDVESLYRGLLQ